MPLSPAQIEYCEQAWAVIIDSELPIPLDISRAAVASTLTGYSERDRTVYLGTNAFPNAQAATANARLSVLASRHPPPKIDENLVGPAITQG
jgi:hypothetical protein